MKLLQLGMLMTSLMPFLALASPVEVTNPINAENTIFKRGVDICNRKEPAGSQCRWGPGGGQPHVCGQNDPRAILNCVNKKWKLERRCKAGYHCDCTFDDDIVCSPNPRPPI